MSCFYSKDFSYISSTDVENQFICQYLPIASGNSVKVYLYGLFLCKNNQFPQTLSDIAKAVDLTEQEVLDSFNFWEDFGLVNVHSTNPLSVQFLPIRELNQTKPRKIKAEKYADFTKAVQSIISSRMIGTNEYSEYFTIMETYSIKPEAMIMIVKYCADLKGKDIGYKYISKVAKDFGNRGLITPEKIEKELASYVLKTAELQSIFHALSLKRAPEIEDINFYKKWTSDLSFEFPNIVYAAKQVKKGGMEKLDALLMQLYSMKCFSKEEMGEYFAKKQAVYQLAIDINRALSVYQEVIDTVIDTYTNKWLSYGYTGETLLFIASYCFKNSKNSLAQMDELIEVLRNRGFIDLSSVADYFNDLKKTDDFINKLLLIVGISRRATPWDRENLTTWKSWNFTEEMIVEAAKLASGKGSPIAYMNGILSNWKNNNVFTPENIISSENSNAKTNANLSPENYNREYERRRAKAISIAQRNNDNAMEIEGFSKAYARYFSIEKDLAFAEISGNTQLLEDLEKEKVQLIDNLNNMLKTINLDLSDLSPKYACTKCNDTGYVGPNRCDCFNKK